MAAVILMAVVIDARDHIVIACYFFDEDKQFEENGILMLKSFEFVFPFSNVFVSFFRFECEKMNVCEHRLPPLDEWPRMKSNC